MLIVSLATVMIIRQLLFADAQVIISQYYDDSEHMTKQFIEEYFHIHMDIKIEHGKMYEFQYGYERFSFLQD